MPHPLRLRRRPIPVGVCIRLPPARHRTARRLGGRSVPCVRRRYASRSLDGVVLTGELGRRDDDVIVTEQKPRGRVAAAVVGTLSPGDVGKPFTDEDRGQAMISHDWQMLGAQYEWAELHGVTRGLPHGYFADLLGRAAAAGEQLGLAFAALRDAEVWRDAAVEPSSASRRTIAGRAMADASGHWAVSAGRAAVNVALRS